MPPLLVCLWMALGAGSAPGQPLWQEDEQRLRVGLKLFAAVLGAVESAAGPDAGALRVAVVHRDFQEAAHRATLALRDLGKIRDRPLQVTTLEAQALDAYSGPPLDAVFVASVGLGEKRLRGWSEGLHTLVFSPFAGDVEAGAVAGIHVSDQILPFVNLAQAERAGVRFKPFFLRVARRHD